MNLRTNGDHTTLRTAHLKLRRDSILHVEFKDFVEVRYRDAMELLACIRHFLPEGGRVLFQYGRGVFITNEARLELVRTPAIHKAAFLAQTQTSIMLATFLLRFSQLAYPAIVSRSRQEAITWLQTK